MNSPNNVLMWLKPHHIKPGIVQKLTVDIAVACLIELATTSKSLERAVTDILCCCRHKYAAGENKSA